jgi:NDP-sugar pyrophosphorylase family protein
VRAIRQAAILAGGLGTRLRATSGDLPKSMVPVGDKPFLRCLVELLRDRGMNQVVLLTGYRAEAIQEHFAQYPVEGIEISYSREPHPLGTGGAIRLAVPQLESRFVLVNGDTYLDVPYADLLEETARQDALATMVIYRDAHGELDQAGNVNVDADGFVIAYEKASDPPLPYIDAGVCVWSRHVFDVMFARPDPFSLERDVFAELVARRQLWSFISSKRYYDIGTPERLALFASQLLLGQRPDGSSP